MFLSLASCFVAELSVSTKVTNSSGLCGMLTQDVLADTEDSNKYSRIRLRALSIIKSGRTEKLVLAGVNGK